MRLARHCIAILISASALLGACDTNPTTWKTPNMTPLSPRLQHLFEKTRTVCFGRFLIDMPEKVELAWGEADVPLGVSVFKGQASTIDKRIAEREMALKAEARYPASKNLSLYFETIDGQGPGMKHIVSQQNFDSTGLLRIDSYYAMGPDLIYLEALPMEEHKIETIAELNDMARRLKPRADTEVPTEPGLCIEHAFLPDPPGVALDKTEGEHIRVGFSFKELPDVNLSIYTAPANTHDTRSDSLERQLKSTEDEARNAGKANPFENIEFFRKAKRQIHEWTTGYEVLTKTPEEEGSHAHHDFWMKFTGIGHDVFKPYADVQLQTGVGHDAAGAVKASLTDEEAIALWDKLTSSIRVRPTGGAKTSQAGPEKAPLGILAATGRACPQTGWWDCAEVALPVRGGRRQFFTAGEPMPEAVLLGKPSLLQRARGDAPTYPASTVWKLVGYDTPSPAVASDKSPSDGQA